MGVFILLKAVICYFFTEVHYHYTLEGGFLRLPMCLVFGFGMIESDQKNEKKISIPIILNHSFKLRLMKVSLV